MLLIQKGKTHTNYLRLTENQFALTNCLLAHRSPNQWACGTSGIQSIDDSKMQHCETRDLWLQREVALGKVVVNKVDAKRNPADLMTKYRRKEEIEERLQLMGIRIQWDDLVRY